MLTLSNISVSYDGSRILRDVSLAVSPGQVVCLMGRNGAGKTAPSNPSSAWPARTAAR